MFDKLKNSFYQFKNKFHYDICSKYDKFMYVIKGNDNYCTEIEESKIAKLEKLKKNFNSSKISNFMKTFISQKNQIKKNNLVENNNTISQKILSVIKRKNRKNRKRKKKKNRKNRRKKR